MKSHSGTHSGTAVSDLETVNFLIIGKRGQDNQVEILYGKEESAQKRCNGEL